MSDPELAVVATQTFQAPSLIERAGAPTKKKFFEFFTVPIRNDAAKTPEAGAYLAEAWLSRVVGNLNISCVSQKKTIVS